MYPADMIKEHMKEQLTRETAALIIGDVVNAFDIELIRAQNENLTKDILHRTMGWYMDTNLYAFFTSQSIENFSDLIFGNEALQSFVLNFTDRAIFLWFTKDVTFNEELVRQFAKTVVLNKCTQDGDMTYGLLPIHVKSSIAANEDTVVAMFVHNPWLFVCYILIVNFHETEAFKQITKNKGTK